MNINKYLLISAIVALGVFGFFKGISAGYPCDNNGVCAWPETGNTCSDCRSFDIASYAYQRAKYIDRNCQYNGNGLSDNCATSGGGAGRFNELQSAINSLVAGDTLYIYPGDYYRAKQAYTYGNYSIFLQNSGTAERPVIITARDRNNPPVLHSLNPQGGDTVSNPALTTHWDDAVHHIIIDGLKINGLLKVTGHNNVIQNVDCTFGGGACDGNWACLRIEWCTDCIAHHNYVHDVDDQGFCAAGTSRPSGLKEFSSTRAIWEFNTVRNALQWGYDLHRSSVDPIIRYNKLENSGFGVGIRFGRSGDNFIYGNTVIGSGACIRGLELNHTSIGHHNDLIDHNTCVFPSMAISTDSLYPSTVTNNVISNVGTGRVEQGNISIQGTGNMVDYNAWDSNGYYHSGLYEGRDYESLALWQQATSHDSHSHESQGGYCQFVDAPTSVTDFLYDLRVTGACLTASNTGGSLGAYGLTDCVGYLCATSGGSPDTTPPSAPTGVTVE